MLTILVLVNYINPGLNITNMHINSYLICMYACIYVCILFYVFLFFLLTFLVLVNYDNPGLDNKHYRHKH